MPHIQNPIPGVIPRGIRKGDRIRVRYGIGSYGLAFASSDPYHVDGHGWMIRTHAGPMPLSNVYRLDEASPANMESTVRDGEYEIRSV